MSDPFVGEIRFFAGNFAPQGWMFCNGSLLSIAENEVLFQLIGTTYGGDGQSTFALPDLSSRVVMHAGTGPGLQGPILGEQFGQEAQTLPDVAHNHLMPAATGRAMTSAPQDMVFAVQREDAYAPAAPSVPGGPSTNVAGGGQPFPLGQPVLVTNFIISLFGIFPSP